MSYDERSRGNKSDDADADTTKNSKRRNGTRRIQLDMPAIAMKRLQVLKDRAQVASYGEGIRRALQVYEEMTEITLNGKRIIIVDNSIGETDLYICKDSDGTNPLYEAISIERYRVPIG